MSARGNRLLKRRGTPSGKITLEEWPVVPIEGQKLPVPVGPPLQKNGKRCVRVCATCPWLQKIAFGHQSYQQHESEYSRSWIQKMRGHAKSILNLQEAAGVLEDRPVASDLVQEDDDLACLDDDSSGDEPEPAPKPKRAPKVRPGRSNKSAMSSWVQVMVGTTPVNVLLGQGTTLFMELEADALSAMVAALREERRAQGSAPDPEAERARQGALCLTDADEGRLTWSDARQSFLISYTGKNSKKTFCHSRPDLKVHVVRGEDFVEECERTAKRGRKLWDSLDHSGAAKYSQTEEATSSCP